MNKILLSVLVLLVAAVGGCGEAYRPLRIEPVKQTPIKVIQPRFDESFYRADRDGSVYFFMRSQTADRITGEPVEQVAIIRMFWTPIGGATPMDPAALNATFRYILMTPKTVGMYEGAGFVRIYDGVGTQSMSARVVDGDLRLTEATSDFVDNLGRSRFRGNFKASFDNAGTLDRTLEFRRRYYNQTFVLRNGVPPTQPASASMPNWGMGPAIELPLDGAKTQPATAPASMPGTQP